MKAKLITTKLTAEDLAIFERIPFGAAGIYTIHDAEAGDWMSKLECEKATTNMFFTGRALVEYTLVLDAQEPKVVPCVYIPH